MDFFILLKQVLGKRNPITLNGLLKTVQEKRNKKDMTVLRKVYFHIKFELELIVNKHGYQKEANRCKKSHQK